MNVITKTTTYGYCSVYKSIKLNKPKNRLTKI